MINHRGNSILIDPNQSLTSLKGTFKRFSRSLKINKANKNKIKKNTSASFKTFNKIKAPSLM